MTNNSTALSNKVPLALIALGILSTVLALTLYFWLVGAAGSVYASLVTYVVPVFGLLGWAVLGEKIGPGTALGSGLITGGVAVLMYGPAAQAWLAETATQLRGPALADAPVLIDKEEYA